MEVRVFDCSSLTFHVWQHEGLEFLHSGGVIGDFDEDRQEDGTQTDGRQDRSGPPGCAGEDVEGFEGILHDCGGTPAVIQAEGIQIAHCVGRVVGDSMRSGYGWEEVVYEGSRMGFGFLGEVGEVDVGRWGACRGSGGIGGCEANGRDRGCLKSDRGP